METQNEITTIQFLSLLKAIKKLPVDDVLAVAGITEKQYVAILTYADQRIMHNLA